MSFQGALGKMRHVGLKCLQSPASIALFFKRGTGVFILTYTLPAFLLLNVTLSRDMEEVLEQFLSAVYMCF